MQLKRQRKDLKQLHSWITFFLYGCTDSRLPVNPHALSVRCNVKHLHLTTPHIHSHWDRQSENGGLPEMKI